jgi:hypothetical protein
MEHIGAMRRLTPIVLPFTGVRTSQIKSIPGSAARTAARRHDGTGPPAFEVDLDLGQLDQMLLGNQLKLTLPPATDHLR